MYKSCFLGFGSYVPKRIVNNDELSLSIDTDDEWIKKRTGISVRHIADSSESNVDMAFEASSQAIVNANILPEDIDLIIFATTTPDHIFPGCGTLLQSRLGCNKAVAFDVQAVCSGFLFAVSIADSFISNGKFKNVLVIGSEVMSSIVDWKDRSTAILFGDGAGVAVMSRSSSNSSVIIDNLILSDGNLSSVLIAEAGVRSGSLGKIKMNGRSVFEHAVQKMTAVSLDLIRKNSFSIDMIDWFVPHQANIRIIDLVAQKIGIERKKVLTTVDKHANTSAASIPMAMNHFVSDGTISKGDVVLISAVGGGLTWGSALFKY